MGPPAALAMPADASFEAALASLGVLASHSCDAPLAPGSTLAPGCAVCGERRRGRRKVSGEALRARCPPKSCGTLVVYSRRWIKPTTDAALMSCSSIDV